jgi:hypothetical protein
MPDTKDVTPREQISLTIDEVQLLARLLDDLDAFLRHPAHGNTVWAAMQAYAIEPGTPQPGYLIDAVGFHAMRLHRLATTARLIDTATDEPAHDAAR